MPSSTRKQARFMAACAHGAGYSSCPPSNVSREFNQADAGTGVLRVKHGIQHEAPRRHSRNGR